MALGRTGRPFARLVAGAWLALICLVLCVPGKAAALPSDYLESFGPDGTAATEFARPAALGVDQETGAVYVGDSATQTLYKFDADGNPLNWGGGALYISGNEITGLSLNEGNPGTAEVAVDSSTHVVYVTSANNVRAFESNGEPHEFTEGLGAGTSEIPGATELYGVAVDDSGNIYASDFADKKVRIYSQAGALITEFEPERFEPLIAAGVPLRPGTVAVAPDGTLYITDFGFPVVALEPSRFPVTGKTTYGLGQQVNSRLSVSVAVDPTTQYVYIGELCSLSEACESRVSVYEELGGFVGAIGAEGPGELEGHLPAGLGVNGDGESLYGAIRGDGGTYPSQVSVFETFPLPVGPPTILGSSATNVTSSSAVLRARFNPNALETTYWFEYGLADCAEPPEVCTEVPSGGAQAGAGHLPVSVSSAISELSPGTSYFFRVVAKNSAGVEKGPTRTFITQVGHFGSRLADERVWEQVTPVNKFGGAISNAGPVQADPDGSGISFQTRGSIVEDPEGNRALELAAVLARRSGSGWTVNESWCPVTPKPAAWGSVQNSNCSATTFGEPCWSRGTILRFRRKPPNGHRIYGSTRILQPIDPWRVPPPRKAFRTCRRVPCSVVKPMKPETQFRLAVRTARCRTSWFPPMRLSLLGRRNAACTCGTTAMARLSQSANSRLTKAARS